MASVFISLLPIGIGAALGGPAWTIMALILLRGEGGVAKAAAFTAGAITVRLLQFCLFSRVFGAIVAAEGEDVFELIPATLLLLAGLLLIITAVKSIWWRKEDDPDAPPPKWMTILSSVSPLKAFGMAVVIMAVGVKQWVFTLSAIATVDEAKVGHIGTVTAFLFFVVIAHVFALTLIVTSVFAPAHSAKLVEAILRWLERKSRLITILVSLAFGFWFLSRGMSAFLAHGTAKIPTN